MEYHFSELDPFRFQRLINAVLTNRFGESARLTPLRGADGGRDGETAVGNPFFEYLVPGEVPPWRGIQNPPRPGRYLFQVKHHRTTDTPTSELRRRVLREFESELKANVLSRTGDARVNYFLLFTNVPVSKDALERLDERRAELLRGVEGLHADIAWKEQVGAYLDQMPHLWSSFPEMFAGGRAPFLGLVAADTEDGLPKAMRLALDRQFSRDCEIKFRQLDLKTDISTLFVDLDVQTDKLPAEVKPRVLSIGRSEIVSSGHDEHDEPGEAEIGTLVSALGVLLDETSPVTRKIVLEGGPGQGKSTCTQMAAQIYRNQLLQRAPLETHGRWVPPRRSRLPFRVDLRAFGEWLSKRPDGSVDAYMADQCQIDSGGRAVSVADIQNAIERSPVILLFDGLDEVGSDELRDLVIQKITDCVGRFESGLNADVRAVITTRPPAIAGRRELLTGYVSFPINSLTRLRIDDYVSRWVSIQIPEPDERERIAGSFQRRRSDRHVAALAKNPMQLSVLLHLIRFKGEAFPDRRADLYRAYFETVIDRDVEKSPALSSQRDVVEALHQLLGYKIHALTEVKKADGLLPRTELLELVREWLREQGNQDISAEELFQLGEERLGLVVVLRGEGSDSSYGFHVQPIREYFAAAYINEQICGNANEVFQVAARRSFWHQVALFLAGLRRLNEKADLLNRALDLDRDPVFGWRQDGRRIVYELLEDGVFSQPRHVFNAAVDALFETLDRAVVPVQPHLHRMRSELPEYIQKAGGERYRAPVLALIDRYTADGNHDLLQSVYRVASTIVPRDLILERIRSFRGQPSLVAYLHLSFAPQIGIHPDFQWLDSEWWDTIEPVEAARALVYTSHMMRGVGHWPIPAALHPHLVEALFSEFLFSPEFPGPSGELAVEGDWAAWHLLNYRLALSGLVLFRLSRGRELAEPMCELASKPITISYDGLTSETGELIAEFIDVQRKALEYWTTDEPKRDLLEEACDRIAALMERPNRDGWMAFVIASDIINVAVGEVYSRPIPEDEPAASLFDLLSDDIHRGLLKAAAVYVVDPGEELTPDLADTFFNGTAAGAVPRNVRLTAGGPLVNVADVWLDAISSNDRETLGWLTNVSYSGWILVDLVTRGTSQLALVLRELSTINVRTWRLSGPRLPNEDLEQVLAVARSTEDPAILKGALVAVLSNPFVEAAGVDLLLKMLRSADSDVAASYVFGENRSRHVDSSGPEIAAITEAAQYIIDHPEEFGYDLVAAAAQHLLDYQVVRFSDMVDEEDRLQIRCG